MRATTDIEQIEATIFAAMALAAVPGGYYKIRANTLSEIIKTAYMGGMVAGQERTLKTMDEAMKKAKEA